jgi:hypothetical protein
MPSRKRRFGLQPTELQPTELQPTGRSAS